jgi:hypothetical protein
MYVVAVEPAGALATAGLRFGREGGPGPLPTARFRPGARLYSDAPDRVATGEHRPPFAWQEPEPSAPDELDSSALVQLPDADREVAAEEYAALELSARAEVWVGWFPDETRNFRIARKWLLVAEENAGSRRLMVARLRAHALVQAGDWERAYEEFSELMAARPPADKTVPAALQNFLLFAVYERHSAGDLEAAAKWHARLRAEFPSWTMPAAETAEHVARLRGLPAPRGAAPHR